MKKFKNDKERIAFLEDYRNEQNGWHLWKHDDDLQRRWWRHDLPDGSSLIVEEQQQTFQWPNMHVAWRIVSWFIVENRDGSACFADYTGSRSMALQKIKEIEKEMKA